jgi:uncharacterized Zn-binding protein involved in type VI secretion
VNYKSISVVFTIVLLSPSVFASVISERMEACKKKPGWEWQRMSGVGCVQKDCNERPHAHWSYTRACICAAGDNIDDPEEDKYSKPCYAPEDDPSCPGCLTMCILPTELCPGEKPKATTTTTVKADDGDQKYGVIERDGKLYINSPPGEILRIKTSNLPYWAQYHIATIGAMIAVVGPPDTVIEGDSNVFLDGKPVARVGDGTAHGGTIVEGSDRIFINGVPAAVHGSFATDPLVINFIPTVGGPIVCGCGVEDIDKPEDYSKEMVPCIKDKMKKREEDPESREGKSLDEFCKTMERRAQSDPVAGSSAAWAHSEYCRPSVRALDKPATKGSKVLEVDSEGIEVGDSVVIGNVPELSESGKVAGKGSIILEEPLKNSYPAETLVTRVPDVNTYKIPGSHGKEPSKPNILQSFDEESGIIIAIIGILSILGVAILVPLTLIALIVIVIIALIIRKRKKKSKE